MREIKFRAWYKQRKMFFYWGFNNDDGSWFNGPPSVPDAIQMKYTGLHDKVGKEIYEGDILRFGYYFEHGQWGETKPFCKVVQWINEACGFAPIYGTGEFGMPRNSFEVIGNIYENPELIGKAGG